MSSSNFHAVQTKIYVFTSTWSTTLEANSISGLPSTAVAVQPALRKILSSSNLYDMRQRTICISSYFNFVPVQLVYLL